jgi:hypothetical protein
LEQCKGSLNDAEGEWLAAILPYFARPLFQMNTDLGLDLIEKTSTRCRASAAIGALASKAIS